MAHASKPLAGKVALVTGGSRGIGAAVARRLAAEGTDVALTYASSKGPAEALAKEIAATGVRAAAFAADQGDPAAAPGLVRAVLDRFGRLDILVNNAGVFVGWPVGDPAADGAALERLSSVNVAGVAALVRAAAPFLPEGGRIVTIGSCMAERFPFPGAADYCASKAAVAAYTRGWARDLGARGITVNTVQPGPIETDMNPDGTDFAKTLKATIALGRYGRTEEVAAAVAFLAGPEASYVTGSALTVDGGFNA
ncbi:MAG: SDR family oxidoreductase [Planctomycetes bacterium]|nr:SDR family oxidoreductase [Planctomycetota bacterium]